MARSAILLLRDRREIGDRSTIRDYDLAIGPIRPSPNTVQRVVFGSERQSPVHLRLALPESASRLQAALGLLSRSFYGRYSRRQGSSSPFPRGFPNVRL
jgi:hypothetical protein